MGKTVTTYLIDGDPKGAQYVFVSKIRTIIDYACSTAVHSVNFSHVSKIEEKQK